MDMDKLKAYRITKDSSDGTFLKGDIIWKSANGAVNSVQGKGWIDPEEGDENTFDFECEVATDWNVITRRGEELCRKSV